MIYCQAQLPVVMLIIAIIVMKIILAVVTVVILIIIPIQVVVIKIVITIKTWASPCMDPPSCLQTRLSRLELLSQLKQDLGTEDHPKTEFRVCTSQTDFQSRKPFSGKRRVEARPDRTQTLLRVLRVLTEKRPSSMMSCAPVKCDTGTSSNWGGDIQSREHEFSLHCWELACGRIRESPCASKMHYKIFRVPYVGAFSGCLSTC